MLDRRGQVRLVEVILAVTILTSALVTAMSLTMPIRSLYMRESFDLEKAGYSVLNEFAEAGIYENVIVKGNLTGAPWEDEMKLLLATNLPPQVLFRMDVYELKFVSGTPLWVKLNKKPISNVANWTSAQIVEAESITYPYVCIYGPDKARGTFLKIVLTLGYGG